MELTVLLAGSGTIFLGKEKFEPENTGLLPEPVKKCDVSGHHISVINMLGFQETEKVEEQHSPQRVSLCRQEIHAFLLLIPLGQFTKEDNLGLEWLHRTFGDRCLEYTMIIFTYEDEKQDTVVDDLKGNSVFEQLIDQCKGRYHTCHQSKMDSQETAELLEKIEAMLSNNRQCGNTVAIYGGERAEEQQQESQTGNNGKPVKENSHADASGKCSVSNGVATAEDKETEEKNSESPADGMSCDRKQCKAAETEKLFGRLKLKDRLQNKLTTRDALQISHSSLQKEPQTEHDLAHIFLRKLFMMDYRCRYITVTDKSGGASQDQPTTGAENTEGQKNAFNLLFNKTVRCNETNRDNSIHPMDVQMAVFLCADKFLQQYMGTKLSLCQYALPLILPNPISQQTECPLWIFRQITKSWKSVDIDSVVTSKTVPIHKAELPMVFIFRLGSVSASKSSLLNNLINQRHNTFFHRHCPGSNRKGLLMDGVAEIAWYCPSGKDTDDFRDCVTFCNLHGDAQDHEEQRKILTEKASVNIIVLPELEKNNKAIVIVEELFNSSKPLICLRDEDDSTVTEVSQGKYKMGLKDRNQSDITKELIKTIRGSLAKPYQTFKLEDMQNTGFSVDEDNEDCQTGKVCALEIMEKLKGSELSKIKEEFFPCQGKLWHDWSMKKKDLHHLDGDLEKEKSKIEQDMRTIRRMQRDSQPSEVIKSFVKSLVSLNSSQRVYFLKWLGNLLDDCFSEKLSELHHKYDEKWTNVLHFKKGHNKSTEKLRNEQQELENISDQLNAATFGMEHFVREIGQIYEAWIDQKALITVRERKVNIGFLPELAAELMISGYPMELMDGDAAHVPLTWIDAVLDKIIEKLEDKRIFVLSVLGVQSTGKSTMLNAMFGLQFAVSAGRCTRGAFMQLVALSEDMKVDLKFDYILVVDTEGLRALELAGKATLHHDNQLATFVTGLGDMTLINVFGENPAEMQDVLQIVVQAFLRMKKVKLSPSCIFVHQNVGDITAGEKNTEGQRRLQEKLDEMTRLAAKEEECDVECFSDVIAFDVKRDVKYFSQLWEGSPPMAPPNPSYSENIQDLKQTILSETSKSKGRKLSQFKTRIHDLWNALLNENFVFSFKNTLEIAVYRKLEIEYGKWTWTLRKAMLMVENKLHNRIENEKLNTVGQSFLVDEMKESVTQVQKMMGQYFEESNEREILIQWKGRFICKINELHDDLIKTTKRKFAEVIQQKEACKKLDEKRVQHENELFNKSKELALNLKNTTRSEAELSREFDSMWELWVSEQDQETPSIKDINVKDDVLRILSEDSEFGLVHEQNKSELYKKILILGDYSCYTSLHKHLSNTDETNEGPSVVQQNQEKHFASSVYQWGLKVTDFVFRRKKTLSHESRNILTTQDEDVVRTLLNDITRKMKTYINEKPIATMGYNVSYIQEIIKSVREEVNEFESKCNKFRFKKEFIIDISLYVCEIAEKKFGEFHTEFKEKNDAQKYLCKMKSQYYQIFKHYCQGATSSTVFSEYISSKLKTSIFTAVCEKTAIDMAGEMRASLPAFSGNRSNLEIHVLRSLAEEESFDKFMTYIHSPREHFKNFIRNEVKKYLHTNSTSTVLQLVKENVRQMHHCLTHAVSSATKHTKEVGGDVIVWLNVFCDKVTDELRFARSNLKGVECPDITDFDFLEEVMQTFLKTVIADVSQAFTTQFSVRMCQFEKRPYDILIKQLCGCCWVQCPFCKAICTNTIDGHDGDHQVPFHRTNGINGWIYRGTNNLCINFCTTAVASNKKFWATNKDLFPYKKYREAGPKYACWSITPDNSQLSYWKWFMCRFQKDLEHHYQRTFEGHGEIPLVWRNCTKRQALKSLDYIN